MYAGSLISSPQPSGAVCHYTPLSVLWGETINSRVDNLKTTNYETTYIEKEDSFVVNL